MASERFAGKRVFVTGGSRGIGRAIVERFAREGADVAFVYRRNAAAAEAVLESVRRMGRRGLAVPADFTRMEAVDAAWDAVGEAFGRVDVFVANAAATAFRPLLDMRAHHFDLTFALSVKSFLLSVQRAARCMPAGGRIIAISGCDSHRFLPGHGLLGAAKAALESLVRSFAHELAERGITVNAVNPGYVRTDSSRFFLGEARTAALFEEALADAAWVPAWGEPADVAELTAFLASEGARWINGQTLYIDGGTFLAAPGHTRRWWRARTAGGGDQNPA